MLHQIAPADFPVYSFQLCWLQVQQTQSLSMQRVTLQIPTEISGNQNQGRDFTELTQKAKMVVTSGML